METFKNIYNKQIKELRQYIPVVSRVHGKHHNEFYEVEKIFNQIDQKVRNDNFELNDEFSKLSKITNNYLIPSDTCETYAFVYNELNKINQAYEKGK